MINENLYTTDCIRTYTGKYVNVFNPDPSTICIDDIAHSLSLQCRFGAHLPYFYSVAQHSIGVALLCKPENQYAGLLHDASEAYLMDIPRPIKLRLPDYKIIENKLMKVIAEIFGFEYPLNPDVKENDEVMLQSEWHDMFINARENWPRKTPYDAEKAFLELYSFIKPKH